MFHSSTFLDSNLAIPSTTANKLHQSFHVEIIAENFKTSHHLPNSSDLQDQPSLKLDFGDNETAISQVLATNPRHPSHLPDSSNSIKIDHLAVHLTITFCFPLSYKCLIICSLKGFLCSFFSFQQS